MVCTSEVWYIAGGNGGGLYAAIVSSGDASHSSMSFTTVTATNNTAGMMQCYIEWENMEGC